MRTFRNPSSTSVFTLGYGRRVGQREHASDPVNQAALGLIRDGFAVSGMTQEELSRASGIPRSTLANMLSPNAGHRLVHVAQLINIGIALDADLRAWAAELEAFERDRRGDELAGRRSRPAPEVQRRAARSRGGTPRRGE